MRPESTSRLLSPSWLALQTGPSIAVFLLVHVVVAFFLRASPVLGLAHAGLILAIALFALLSARTPFETAAACCYLTGAEVLWRMTNAPLFWEFGKYGAAVVLMASLLKAGRWEKRSKLMVLYFCCLIPGSFILIDSGHSLAEIKDYLSFNLSGPLVLLLAGTFFSGISLTRAELMRLLLFVTGPIASIATLALWSTLTAESITFGNRSNFTTSGGFGPNQVSAMLGLGALICFLRIVAMRSGMMHKAMMFVTMTWFATHSALTFSRTGLYLAAASAAVASLFVIRIPRLRAAFMIAVLGLILTAQYVVIPRLNTFTEGAFATRWSNLQASRREQLIVEDLRIWKENWLLGVGPGKAGEVRSARVQVAAHTEFSRLLAEHGLFGLASMLVLAYTAYQNLRRQRDPLVKGVIAGLLVWSFLFMATSAMRIVAPSCLIGLACARVGATRRKPAAIAALTARRGRPPDLHALPHFARS